MMELKVEDEHEDEVEDVEINSTRLVLPSKICTDKKLFGQLFSMETWTNLLDSEQKERIMKLLPPEILAIPNMGLDTIKDLFNGQLTRFGINPLDQFFNELYLGGYYPEVTKFKAQAQAEWKKEILYRQKIYHTQLFKELIVSTDKYFKKHLSSTDIKSGGTKNNHSKASKQSDTANKFVNTNNPKKPTPTKPPPNGKKKITKNGAKRPIETTNFSSKEVKLDDLPPAPKKPLQVVRPLSSPNNSQNVSKPTKKATGKGKKTPVKSNVIISPPEATPVIKEPQMPKVLPPAPSLNCIEPSISSKEEAPIPPPAPTIVDVPTVKLEPRPTPSLIQPQHYEIVNTPFSTASSIIIAKSTPISVAGRSVISVSHSNVITKEISISNSSILSSNLMPTTSNTIKSSPILASQLQAPLISSIANANPCRTLLSKPMISHLQETFKKAPEPIPLPQVINIPFNRNDDLTSSSDDEFEAIEPTIGFSAVLPMKFVQNSKSLAKSKPSIGVFPTKSLPPKPRAVYASKVTSHTLRGINNSPGKLPIINQKPGPLLAPTTSGTETVKHINSPIYSKVITNSTFPSDPLTKLNIPMPMLTKTEPLTTNTTLSSEQTPKSFPININSTHKVTGTVTKSLDSSSPSTSSDTVKGTSIVSTSITNLATSVSNVQPNCGLKNTPKPTAIIISTRRPTPLATVGIPQPHTSQATKISLVNDVSAVTTSTSVASSSYSSPDIIVPALSPIQLSLGDMNINLGLDIGEEKIGQGIEDKIDDLSVLDGNPFDSIPNLSDELDGLDLDLDGLCDFESLLSEEKQYASFFSFIREVLCSTQFHRMTLVCMERTVRKWSISPSAAMNSWFMRIDDWNEALVTALNFLAGNYQGPNIHPEDFVPYIEYKYKTKYYQWIGAGRDSDNNLLPLCNTWLENLDKLPPLKKQDGEIEEPEDEDDENEDSDDHAEEVKKKYMRPKTPPPPRFATDWTVRPSSEEERSAFQIQERSRFDNPHKAFTYRMHNYESVVGPVKGVYSSQSGITNKARGHSLLVDDRPPYVTILALVRDSVARLPNGEGTRSEICEMLRDSAFLASGASNLTLNSVVSGALDRLHYERDPCVRYDSHKKNWIYLHRDRSQDQFERLHHNRSYTKSTKSRSSNSRKARKKALSQSSATSSTHSISSSLSPGTPSTTTPRNPDKAVPGIDSNPVVKLKNTTSIPTFIPNKTNPPPLSQLTKQDSIEELSVIKPVSIPLHPINIGIPSNTPLTTEATSSINPITTSSYGVTTSTTTPLNFSANASMQNAQSSKSRIFTVNGPGVSIPTTQTSSQYPSMSTSQLLLGSNAVLRLANNLKMPTGVRFAQIRLPLNQAGSNILRLPAQRILLRAALPGHGQTQGVLVGQTSTGQTVILSTAAPIPNLQPIGTQTNQNQQPLATYSLQQPELQQEFKVTMQQPGSGTPSISSSNVNLNTTVATSTASLQAYPKTTVTVHTHSETPRTTTMTKSSETGLFDGVFQNIAVTTQASQIGIGQTQHFTIQRPRQSESTQPGTLSTPIIIRSHQGEFVIPGHMMPRGMHGMKVIPVPAGAGKHVMARLLPPGQGPTVTSQGLTTQEIKATSQPQLK